MKNKKVFLISGTFLIIGVIVLALIGVHNRAKANDMMSLYDTIGEPLTIELTTPSASQESAGVEYSSYQNNVSGFIFDYPADWQIDEISSKQVMICPEESSDIQNAAICVARLDTDLLQEPKTDMMALPNLALPIKRNINMTCDGINYRTGMYMLNDMEGNVVLPNGMEIIREFGTYQMTDKANIAHDRLLKSLIYYPTAAETAYAVIAIADEHILPELDSIPNTSNQSRADESKRAEVQNSDDDDYYFGPQVEDGATRTKRVGKRRILLAVGATVAFIAIAVYAFSTSGLFH